MEDSRALGEVAARARPVTAARAIADLALGSSPHPISLLVLKVERSRLRHLGPNDGNRISRRIVRLTTQKLCARVADQTVNWAYSLQTRSTTFDSPSHGGARLHPHQTLRNG